MENLLIARDKPCLNKADSSLSLELLWYNISGYHMMSIYHIVRVQLSFGQFSILSYDFCILSKTESMSI